MIRRAGFLAVMLSSGALLAQTAITPIYSVQPDVLPAAQVSEVWLTVRTSTAGQLSPAVAGANAADAFTFTFDATNNVGGPVISSADDAVTLHVSNKTSLVPGNFTISAPTGGNTVVINYVKATATSLAAGDSFSLRVGLQPKIDTAFSCGVTFTETSHATLPTGGQTLAFVDFAVGTKGATGATGPAGPQGAAGAVGAQGPAGLTGASGPAGAQGAAGPAGAAGPQGPAGAQGATGPAGATGAAGQSVTGSSEPAGANCPAGGAKYVSAGGTTFVCNGAQGSAGSAGAQGATGAQGPAGAQGQAGAQGLAGAQGPAGAAGAQGVAGAIGPAGPKGDTGAAGPQGAAGAQGPAGADGAKSGGCSTSPRDVQPAFVPLLAALAFAFRRRRRG